MSTYFDRLREERSARLSRIAARAVSDKPIACLSASARSESALPRPRKILRPDVPPATPKPPVEKIWFRILDDAEDNAPPFFIIATIQRIVARHFGFHRRDLLSQRRTKDVVYARHLAIYLTKELTPKSLPEIGRGFAGRDHTTVLHAVRKFDRWVAEDPALAAKVEQLKARILEATTAA